MRRDAVGMIGAIGRGSAGAVEGERGIGGVWERAGMGAAVEVMWKAYGRGGGRRRRSAGRWQIRNFGCHDGAGQGTDGNSVEFLA